MLFQIGRESWSVYYRVPMVVGVYRSTVNPTLSPVAHGSKRSSLLLLLRSLCQWGNFWSLGPFVCWEFLDLIQPNCYLFLCSYSAPSEVELVSGVGTICKRTQPVMVERPMPWQNLSQGCDAYLLMFECFSYSDCSFKDGKLYMPLLRIQLVMIG